MNDNHKVEIEKMPTDNISSITGEVPPTEDSLDDNMVRDLYYAIEILKQQMNRIDPDTGNILEINSSYDNIRLSGALFQIIEFVKEILPRKPRLRRNRKSRLRRYLKTTLPRERSIRPNSAAKSWSDEESKLLSEQFDKGIGILELAIIHQRSKGAIRSRLKKLGKIET